MGTYKPVPLEERCEERVRDSGRWPSYHSCERRWKLEEEGKRWCKQHAPSTLKAKGEANNARYEARCVVLDAKWAKEAEDRRKVAAYDGLLAARRCYEGNCQNASPHPVS